MTLGVIGKKLGMTQVFDEQGLAIPVTVIKVDPLTVTQVKTVDTDGYNAIQTGVDADKEKHFTKAELGHFAKNKLENLIFHMLILIHIIKTTGGGGSLENRLLSLKNNKFTF